MGTSELDTNDGLMRAIEGLVRGTWQELESTLHPHEAAPVSGTKATLRTHYLVSDPNGRQRMQALAAQLAGQIVLFCIPRSRIEAARNAPAEVQIQEISQLYISAQKLFTQTQATTGEGAELLLYSLLEKSLKIPQVMSKMSFKTNTEMHIHGTDGIHAKILDNGDLALYWGEAKMYEDLDAAISSCFSSLAPFLLGEQSADEQDIFLINHYADTGDEALKIRLLEYFDNMSMKSAQVEVRGACLIGFAIDEYPRVPRELDAFKHKMEQSVQKIAEKISKRISGKLLHEFEIEVFAVPVPSAQEFREPFCAPFL